MNEVINQCSSCGAAPLSLSLWLLSTKFLLGWWWSVMDNLVHGTSGLRRDGNLHTNIFMDLRVGFPGMSGADRGYKIYIHLYSGILVTKMGWAYCCSGPSFDSCDAWHDEHGEQ